MLIKELKLFTSNLNQQVHFYKNVIGLELIELQDETVSFTVGDSILKFDYKEQITPYHFAVNIPYNQSNEALVWLKDRVEILKNGNDEIQHFTGINAKSIYFYDFEGNIVEFISRVNLGILSKDKFSVDNLLNISEIGLATEDIERDYNQLNSIVQLDIFNGTTERFCTVGDQNGLFIFVNKNIKDWFPTNDKAYSSPFEVTLVEGSKTHHIIYENEELMEGTCK